MSRLWKHVPRTVRPRSARRTPVLFCLLAFGLTAIIVYRWGYENWHPVNPRPTYAATAYVVQRPHEAASPQAAGEVRIPITQRDDDPGRAEEAANAGADRYVQERRAEWKRRMEGPYLKAHAAAEKARREQRQAEDRLEAFRRQMAEAAKPQADAEQRAKPSLPMTDNPQWLDLDRQLAELQQRRDNLLVDRTPQHPAVQDVTGRIEDLQHQIAGVPKQIPKSTPSPAGKGAEGEGGVTSERATAASAISEPDQAKLSQLSTAVEAARQACKKAEAAERRALAEQQTGPQCAVVYAHVVEIPPTPDYGWRRLLWTTLVAGVLMAFGVGSVSAGARLEPSVGSAAQVQAAARAVVVGTIPADDPVPQPAKLSRRQWRRRRTLVALGLLLIVACPAAAVWGIMGI
jgi:hypothetical protein